MSIPKFNEIMPYVFEVLLEHSMLRNRDVEEPVAQRMGVEQQARQQVFEASNRLVFLNRVFWAISYLKTAKIVESPKRAHYQVTEFGKQFIGRIDDLNAYLDETRQSNRKAYLKKRKEKQLIQGNTLDDVGIDDASTNDESTPQEALSSAYTNIRLEIYDTIIDTILSKSPYEFETLVLKLMHKMGYGGKVEDAMQATPKSNDGGIDGIIKEDVLGLGKIYLQAKRYARDNKVGREEVQKFVGALSIAQSNKGVFITTSDYSNGAHDFVNSLAGNSNVVLINGSQLAEYIYDFGLGMQTEQVLKIKKLDADFWDEMQDAR